MSYASWPDISQVARIQGFREFPIHDPTIRTPDADGRPLSRSGTAPILYGYEFELRHLTDADRLLLKTFQDDTVRIGGEPFLWMDPRFEDSGYIYLVRLAQPMEFEVDGEKGKHRTMVLLHKEPDY